MSNHASFRWHVGTDGNVYTDETGGELVATVEHGSEKLRAIVFGKRDSEGMHTPSLKPCRGRLIAAAPDANEIIRELASWFTEGSSGPSKHTMFDDTRTWKEVVADYIAKVVTP